MDRVEELKKQFILDWMPPFMEEYEPGAFEKDVDNLLQQYADEQSRETAIQFKIDTSPLTPSIVDGEKKVREATEKLYDNWKSKQQNNG